MRKARWLRRRRGRSGRALPGALLRAVCGGREGLAPPLFMGLPQSAAPALTTSTPTDPRLAVSQLCRYHRR